MSGLFYFTLALFELPLAEKSAKANVGQTIYASLQASEPVSESGCANRLGGELVYMGCGITPVLILICLDADSQEALAACPTLVTTTLGERISTLFKGGGKPDHS